MSRPPTKTAGLGMTLGGRNLSGDLQGQSLRDDIEGAYKTTAASGSLAGLSDVLLLSPQDGDTIKYNASKKLWLNAKSSGSSTPLVASNFVDDESLDVWIGNTVFALANIPSSPKSVRIVAYDSRGSGTELLNGVAYTLSGAIGTFVTVLDTVDVLYLRAWYRK